MMRCCLLQKLWLIFSFCLLSQLFQKSVFSATQNCSTPCSRCEGNSVGSGGWGWPGCASLLVSFLGGRGKFFAIIICKIMTINLLQASYWECMYTMPAIVRVWQALKWSFEGSCCNTVIRTLSFLLKLSSNSSFFINDPAWFYLPPPISVSLRTIHLAFNHVAWTLALCLKNPSWNASLRVVNSCSNGLKQFKSRVGGLMHVIYCLVPGYVTNCSHTFFQNYNCVYFKYKDAQCSVT